MSIDVTELSVWLPGRGIAVGPIDLHIEGLTVLTGTSGSGASVVAAALSRHLPAGALVRGQLGSEQALVHTFTGDSAAQGFAITVAETLGRDDARARAFAAPVLAGFGPLAPAQDALLSDLAEPVRAALTLLRVLLAADADLRRAGSRGPVLVVLDQPLGAVTPAVRPLLAACIRQCADAGADVLWVEHDLAVAVPAADRVVELVPDGEPWSVDAATWTPRHLPLPPQAALARALGLPRSDWFDLDLLAGRPEVRSGLSLAPRVCVIGADARGRISSSAPASRTGLPFDFDLGPGETLGVVPADADRSRALHVARRISASVDDESGPRAPWEWPAHMPVAALTRRWAARGAAADSALADLAAPGHGRSIRIDARRTLARHSAGERRLIEWTLTRHSGRTEVLDRPELGLDPAGQRRLAEQLLATDPERTAVERSENAPARIVVSHDPEFLVRACHRLLVLTPNGDAVVGRTALVAERLPDAPVLRRLGSKALRVRDLAPQIPVTMHVDEELL